MAALDIRANPPIRPGALTGLILALVTALHRWSETRATREALNALSEHDLEDIGLCRGDIRRMTRS